MKQKILTLLIALCVVAIASAQKTYVLSIGISNYANANYNMTNSSKDAKTFKEVMANHTNNVTLLTSKYANRKNVLAKLKGIAQLANPGDKIVVFFSGHGYNGGICAYDKTISYKEINDILKTSKAGAKICLINACDAGSVSSAKTNYDSPGANIIYLLSSRANEYSYDHPTTGACIFSTSILKGIRGKSDLNYDKKVTVEELFNYVYDDVVQTTKGMGVSQHPQLIGRKDLKDIVLVNWN